MNVYRRLLLLGVLLVVLSMTMATQYATTKIGYEFNIVHPSNADIRYIGSDNSTDGIRILRVDGDNSSGQRNVKLTFGGNFTERQNKTYTAAFGIVNEESFAINITHINVSTTDTDYMQIWLHSDRDAQAGSDATGSSVLVWDKGTKGYSASSCVWQLAAGDQDASSMDGGNIATPWDSTANVRYSNSNTDAINQTDDYVWVQVSLDIADGAASGSYSGTIWVHVAATTH